MKQYFPPKTNFRSLSIADLLEAREAYHAHLINKENVIATAIGLYRIRTDDPDCKKLMSQAQAKSRSMDEPRTLQNSTVKPWSWPCILVFVNNWIKKDDLHKQDPDQVIPEFLYMPDGRIIPTCIVFAQKPEKSSAPLQNFNFPHDIIGGGYPVFTSDQGEEHFGSIACLVTDGNSYYALTNRHVTGEGGRKIYSFFGGQSQLIGISDKKQLGKSPFSDIYPDWPISKVYTNIDAGLILIDDINDWTAQVFGIGELNDPADLNTKSISLDIIGCPVKAFGAASGELFGEIKALFYRYKSIGGIEYVSDLLIGPRDENTPLGTRPGDSGTMWFFDEEAMPKDSLAPLGERSRGARARRFHPIALQWGGCVFEGDSEGNKFPYALATCLSTICRELDLDIVPDWDIGHSEYWGKMGHFKIAARACDLVGDPKLNKLMQLNKENIGFSDEAIESGELKKIDPKQFVPLADIPDIVWRTTRKKDAVNHFADMDEKGKGQYAKVTLLDFCKEKNNISPDKWNSFYESLDVPNNKRGALPFRIAQIFNDMIKFASDKEIDKFVCAAGIISHYVADACQPLHISRLHHGNPKNPEEKSVHSKYENGLLDRYAGEIIAKLNALGNGSSRLKTICDGHDAAVQTVALMKHTITNLPPETVLKAFNAKAGRERLPHMYDVLGEGTVSCMHEGCILLASIWDSAWTMGGGKNIKENELQEVSSERLREIYSDRTFLPAYYLSDGELLGELNPPQSIKRKIELPKRARRARK